MRIDAFLGPGHVSTVIGCRPYEWIARNERRPIVVSGFEPLDILQSIVMLLRQMKDGESKVENQYARVVPWEGNRAALQAMAEVFHLRPYFEWRGMGFISQSALRPQRRLRRMGCRTPLRSPRRPGHRSQSRAMRRSVERRAEAGAVQAVRKGMHAGASGRRADGFVRRLLRRLLQLRASQDFGADRARSRAGPSHEHPVSGSIALSRPADRNGARRRRQSQPPLGGGSVRAAPSRRFHRACSADAAQVSTMGPASVAFTADSFVVHPLRFPGGSIGDLAVNGTANDLAVSGARPHALVVTLIVEAGLPSPETRSRNSRHRPGCRARGRDHRGRRHQSRRARQSRSSLHHHRRHRPSDSRRASLAAAASSPATRFCSAAPIGDHGITILLARGELDLEADLCSDTRSCVPDGRSARERRRSRCALDARSHARRRRHVAQRTGARCAARGPHRRRSDPGSRHRPRRLRVARLDPLHIANEGQFLAVVAADRAEAALDALRQTPGGELAAIIGEISEQPARHRSLQSRVMAARACSTCWSAIRCRESVSQCRQSPPRRPKFPSLARRRIRRAQRAPSKSFSRAKPRASPKPLRKWPSVSCAAAACSPSAEAPVPPTPSTSPSNSFIPSSSANAPSPRSISPQPSAPGWKPSPFPTISSSDSGRPRAIPKSPRALRVAESRGAMTLALPGARGSYFLRSTRAPSLRPSGAHRNPLSHALGNRPRLSRARGAGPRRRQRRLSLSLSRKINRNRSSAVRSCRLHPGQVARRCKTSHARSASHSSRPCNPLSTPCAARSRSAAN